MVSRPHCSAADPAEEEPWADTLEEEDEAWHDARSDVSIPTDLPFTFRGPRPHHDDLADFSDQETLSLFFLKRVAR